MPINDDDLAFIRALESCRIQNAHFRHRDHLRAAWSYLQLEPLPRAAARMERTIRRFALHHRHAAKYHHTLTMAWIHLVAVHAAAHPEPTFDRFIAAQDRLLDKSVVSRFYSDALLWSAHAREHWVEPDLQKLPTIS